MRVGLFRTATIRKSNPLPSLFPVESIVLTRYFDNAATTPIDPRVLEAMLPWLKNGFGNANSPHAFGREARQAVDIAREQVAQAIGATDPEQIVFTSGATEGNNWVLKSFVSGSISPFEHSSVREVAQELDFQTLGEHRRKNPSDGFQS